MTQKLHPNLILILTRSLTRPPTHPPSHVLKSFFCIFSLAENVMVGNLKLHDSQEGIGAFFAKRHPVWEEQ